MRGRQGEIGGGDGRNVELDIDAIDQRAGEARLIFDRAARTTAAAADARTAAAAARTRCIFPER
jgi:hypothetical protein